MLVPMPLVMRGVPAQIFFAVPEKDKNWVKTNLKTRKVGLTLDHPLQVELELDLLAGVDDEGELEDDGEEEAQPCQRPKRPHQNFTFSTSNAVQTSKLTSQGKFSVKRKRPTYSSYCISVFIPSYILTSYLDRGFLFCLCLTQ